MAFPYSSGEVLTAADLNASLGLVLINSQTIGTSVSSVTISDVFSSDFYNYRVVLSNMYGSTSDPIRFTFVSQSGNLAGNRLEMYAGNTTIQNFNTGTGGLAYGEVGRSGTTRQGFSSMDIYAPAIARRAGITGIYYGSGYNGTYAYENPTTTQYTGFVLTPASGTLSGGQIYVYGYNNGA